MRYFRKEEAEALIPRLEDIFAAIAAIAARGEAKAQKARELTDSVALEIEKAQLKGLAVEIENHLQRIADLGAVPKGLSPALVDFPARLEGKEVYLCWKLGEKAVTHYHGLEEGFASRRPLL